MRDIYSLLLKILKSSTPGLVESGTTKMRQGGDGNGLAEVSALSRRRRFVNRPAGRSLRVLVVLAALVVWVGAQPASGQTEDDSVRMIPLAAQVEVPSEIGAVDVEVVALGSDATEVEAGGKSSVLIASDADGTLMLAAANEDGGYLGEGPGAVELGIESTAITLVAVASGRRFGEIDPELAQAIQSHEEFGRLTRLLKALMASDKNYLDRLYSYPQAVTLIKSVAARVASVGPDPTREAGPGFKQLPERDVAQALAAEDGVAYNSESGPIAPVYEDGFYCVPGSSFSWGIFPCSPWNDREPWHWYGNAEGIEALFPDNLLEWVFYFFGAPVAPDIVHTIINAKLGDYLPAPLPEGIYGKLANLIGEATGTPPFLAVAEDTVSGCRSFDISCKEDGLHATANPNFVNYAMELYEDGVYRDWFYTPGNSTINDKILNSGAAYREFQAGPRGDDSVLLSPAINQVRFQRYRFSFAEGDEAGPDRGAVVSFMNTLHLVISVVNVITDVSELRNGVNNADVLNLAQPILECSAEVVNVVKETNPDLIVDGQLVYNSDPEKEVQDLTVELLVNVGAAHLAALQRPACQNLLTGVVKGGVSKSLLKKGTSIIDDVFAAGGRQSVKATADYALIWIKLAVDVVNDLIPVASAYFRPAGDGVDYHLFWKENPKGTPFIHMVSKSRPPTAQFTYTQKGGFRVELDASQTEPGDSDDLSFSWRVNDADVGRGESIVHDFRAEGRYDVELIVVDGNGLSGTFSSAVDVVRGSPPEVTSLECTPTRYDTVRMVAAFSDEDGDIETVEWRSNAGSIEPDRVTSAGTTQVELRVSGSTTWASVVVEDRVGNRRSRVCSVNLEYVPTATLGIDSLSAACGREEPWRACYHRLGMNQGELFEFSVSMPREPTGTWHVAWCAKEDREGLCRGQHDWTTRIDKRFANEAPLTFPMTPPAGAETFWVVAEVRECNKSLCSWPEDFTEVEFHHIEVSVLPPEDVVTPGGNVAYWLEGNGNVREKRLGSADPARTLMNIGRNSSHELVIDFAARKIYWWASGASRSIMRANFDGTGRETLVRGLTLVEDFAIHPGQGKLYFTDGGVHRVNLDGTGRETLVPSLPWPNDLSIDFTNSKLYWVDHRADKIQRANLDGSGLEDVIDSGLSRPEGIALDVLARKIYWTDAAFGHIQRANFDGSGVETVLRGLRTPYSIKIDPQAAKLYWTETSGGRVRRANLDGSGVEDVATGQQAPLGLNLYADGSGRPEPGCPALLSEDVVTPGGNVAYWLEGNGNVREKRLGSADPARTLMNIGRNSSSELVIDFAARKIYWWASGASRSIMRANFDGTGRETLVSGLTLVEDFAIHPGQGKLYFTDGGVHRVNLDGTGRETLVPSLPWPNDLLIDFTNSKLYWVDHRADKIQRANLDGSGLEDVIDSGLSHPEGIALDVSARKMYWTDAAFGHIQRANFDGSGVETVLRGLRTPYSIKIDPQAAKLYWTETSGGRVRRANLDGSGVEDVATGQQAPLGLNLYADGSGRPEPGCPGGGTGQGVLFSEDYESYAVGSLPADYEIVFNGQGDAEQRVEAEGGNRHLRTAGQQSWGLHMRQDFAFDLPGVVSVSWRMRLDNDQDNYGGTDPSGARYADLGSFGVKNTDEVSASLSINKYESDGRIVAYCQEGGGSRPEVQLGVWTEFRMEVDFAAGRYSMYKDGVKFCERATGMVDLSGRWNSWGESSGMRFISGGSGASVTLFDDIVIRGGSGSDSGDGDETDQDALFSDDFSSGTFDKWTTVEKESVGGSPGPGRLTIVDGVLQMDGIGGGNYSLQAVKEIRVSQPYDGYRLSFDWKAVARETPHGLDGVRLYFYDDQDRRIGMLVAVNSGQTRRGGDPLDHVRPTTLANDRFAGIGKLAETFDWERVTLETSMIPGMDPRDVARLELRAWVYNDAGSGGEMHFDNFELRAGGSGSDSGDGDDDGGDDDETGQGVLFSEDFESYAAGSRPPGYEFVMGLTGRGAGEQRVESDGGNQYLRMAGRAGPNNEAVLGKFFDFDVPNVVSVTWRMRVDNDINSYLFRDPDGVRTAVFGAFAIKTEDDPFGAILISKNQSDRKIVAWCPSGSGSRPEVRLGVWSEYRWEIDFAASRYTAYKDGQRFCSAPFPLGNLVSSAGIGFLSGDTVMRFDDIVIRGGSGSGGGGSAGETRVFDGVEFVWVPPGQFQMGSTSSESFSDERPVTQVRISRGFWMGKYEVTQAQWQAVMGSNPSHFTNCGGDCPVERVSWEDVQEFIGKLNGRSGGRPYRLPTEAEWEYAARAGTTEDRYGDLGAIAWHNSNSRDTTHPVGEKAANAWGLHDMLGNVLEWVQDWFGSYPGGSVTDPTGPGSGSYRV